MGSGDIVAVELNPTGIALEVAGDDVEQGRLARPVGSDEGRDGPFLNTQRGAVDSPDPAEYLGHIVHRKQVGHDPPPPSMDAASCSLARVRSPGGAAAASARR